MKVVAADAPARERVLAATRDALIASGASGATASVIATRAGLSQGTIFRYFPTKGDLLCSTAAWVLADVRECAAEDLLRLQDEDLDPTPLDQIDRAMAVVWRQYERPDLVAVHDLFVAARTDADLIDLLDEMDGPHRDQLHAMARAVLPTEVTDRPDFDAAVDFILDGIASIATKVAPNARAQTREQLALFRAAVHAVFQRDPVDGSFAEPFLEPAVA